MHCPQCGHQQTLSEFRFCSRCGFALDDIKEFLTPELRKTKEKKKGRIGGGVAQGLALILLGFVLVSILAIFRDLDVVPQLFVKVAALVFCVGGLVRMCLPFIYGGENIVGEKKSAMFEYDAATNTLIDTNFTKASLPTGETSSFIGIAERNFDTTKLESQPHSVTEHTTKSLENRQELK